MEEERCLVDKWTLSAKSEAIISMSQRKCSVRIAGINLILSITFVLSDCVSNEITVRNIYSIPDNFSFDSKKVSWDFFVITMIESNSVT